MILIFDYHKCINGNKLSCRATSGVVVCQTITDVEIREAGRLENGSDVSGVSYPSLINGASPIVLQIEVDLDDGSWAASAKIGNGAVIDLTTDGTGITDIASFSIENSYFLLLF